MNESPINSENMPSVGFVVQNLFCALTGSNQRFLANTNRITNRLGRKTRNISLSVRDVVHINDEQAAAKAANAPSSLSKLS